MSNESAREGPRRLGPDTILAEVPMEAPPGRPDLVADTMVPIGRDHPAWAAWDDWLRERGL